MCEYSWHWNVNSYFPQNIWPSSLATNWSSTFVANHKFPYWIKLFFKHVGIVIALSWALGELSNTTWWYNQSHWNWNFAIFEGPICICTADSKKILTDLHNRMTACFCFIIYLPDTDSGSSSSPSLSFQMVITGIKKMYPAVKNISTAELKELMRTEEARARLVIVVSPWSEIDQS